MQLTEEDKEAQERLESSLKLRDTWRRASKSAVESTQVSCLVTNGRFLVLYCCKWLNWWIFFYFTSAIDPS